jgi:hypothetical protein
MRRNDVAIYTTSAATADLYDSAAGRSGGAERQMTLLNTRGKRFQSRAHRLSAL